MPPSKYWLRHLYVRREWNSSKAQSASLDMRKARSISAVWPLPTMRSKTRSLIGVCQKVSKSTGTGSAIPEVVGNVLGDLTTIEDRCWQIREGLSVESGSDETVGVMDGVANKQK